MNHSIHWKESPVFIARPHDMRLHRVVVFKSKDTRRKEFAWTVAAQDRNSAFLNWHTLQVFHYDLFPQALMCAQLFSKEI